MDAAVQRLDAVLGQHHQLLHRAGGRQVRLDRRGPRHRSGGNRSSVDLADQPDPRSLPVLGLEDLHQDVGPADPLQPVRDPGLKYFSTLLLVF